jgi:catechol 2,3-dioxygenase-like lactoylglutathione lyase family enzyme
MEPKVHIHLYVNDLSASRGFYQRFFGGMPVKETARYAKFLPELAPVNLALSQREGEQAAAQTLSHLGVQVDSTAEVLQLRARIAAAGIPIVDEMGVDCCYANQNKFWVRDPDGVSWEIYRINRDLPLDEQAVPAEAQIERDGGATVCGPTAAGRTGACALR